MRIPLLTLFALLACALVASAQDADRRSEADALRIYFIDVEGGQSTLIVTPAGQSLLVDAGFPGTGTMRSSPGDLGQARDAQRIRAAAEHAGLAAIDYLLVTHFHPDHDGGVPELARLIPIRAFLDHGTISPDAEQHVPGSMAAFNAYAAVRATARHLVLKPGDRLPLKGLDAVVVSSALATITRPLPGGGASNPACGPAAPGTRDNENPRSTGFRLAFGAFRFVDLGDLSGAPLFTLFCPNDRLGPFDVYLTPHHGGEDVSDPAMLGARHPRVAIVNNGATKGGAAQTLASLHRAQDIEDVWQLHQSENAEAQNAAPDRIANFDERTSYWIKVSAWRDGSFVVTNARTGASRRYPVRTVNRASPLK